MDMFFQGLVMAMTLPNILMMLLGVVIGITFGAIPGLTFITGILLVLPLTFGLEPIVGISLLLGVYCGGMAGGSVSAVLLGIPGTPSAAATVLDGHPLAQQGHAGKALGMALFASVTGGLISLLILACVAPQIAKIAINFGPTELFALVFFGMSTICRVSQGNLVKGVISGVIGIMLTTIGLDPIMGVQRYTFGISNMMTGIQLLPLLIGIFAIPEIVSSIIQKKDNKVKRDGKTKVEMPTFGEIKANLWNIIRSALIGTGIGAIPGSSGPIACFLAYDQAHRASKEPEKFGQGALDGVAAPESANNAVSGGVMIPLLTLGIPGDAASAVIMGALLIHGLQPGPLLFQNNGSLIYAIIVSMLLINLMILVVQYFGIKLFVKVLSIPSSQLNTIILGLCVVGAFAQSSSYYDVIVMGLAGFLGYILKRGGFPTTPLLLGAVLGGTLEDNFRRALVVSQGNPLIFFQRPISCVVLILTVLVLAMPALKSRFGKKKEAGQNG